MFITDQLITSIYEVKGSKETQRQMTGLTGLNDDGVNE